MDNQDLVTTVSQVAGQAMGEMSVGIAIAVLALTDAVANQKGIDREQLFTDMLDRLPEGEGVGHSAIEVMRQALTKVLQGGEQTG